MTDQHRPESEWGEPREIYDTNSGQRRTMGCLTIGCGAPALGLLIAGWAMLVFGPPARQFEKPLWQGFLVAGFAMLVVAVIGWFAYRRKQGWRVYVYDQGMEIDQGKGIERVAWEEIQFVWQQVTQLYMLIFPVRTVIINTIQTRQGKTYVFDVWWRAVGELGQTVQQEVFRRRFPECVQKLEAGEKLAFGDIVMGKQGLIIKGSHYLWEDMKAVRIANGVFQATLKNSWFAASVPVASIPCFFLLFELIKREAPRELLG